LLALLVRIVPVRLEELMSQRCLAHVRRAAAVAMCAWNWRRKKAVNACLSFPACAGASYHIASDAYLVLEILPATRVASISRLFLRKGVWVRSAFDDPHRYDAVP
jgi:hypothetical protein